MRRAQITARENLPAGIGKDLKTSAVSHQSDLQSVRIKRRTREITGLLSANTPVPDTDVLVDDSVLVPGYGQINDAVMSAITRPAPLEALLLDPVYSGRTMAGLIALIEQGVINKGESVLFIHTGGLPSLFAYQIDLMQHLQAASPIRVN